MPARKGLGESRRPCDLRSVHSGFDRRRHSADRRRPAARPCRPHSDHYRHVWHRQRAHRIERSLRAAPRRQRASSRSSPNRTCRCTLDEVVEAGGNAGANQDANQAITSKLRPSSASACTSTSRTSAASPTTWSTRFSPPAPTTSATPSPAPKPSPPCAAQKTFAAISAAFKRIKNILRQAEEKKLRYRLARRASNWPPKPSSFRMPPHSLAPKVDRLRAGSAPTCRPWHRDRHPAAGGRHVLRQGDGARSRPQGPRRPSRPHRRSPEQLLHHRRLQRNRHRITDSKKPVKIEPHVSTSP